VNAGYYPIDVGIPVHKYRPCMATTGGHLEGVFGL